MVVDNRMGKLEIQCGMSNCKYRYVPLVAAGVNRSNLVKSYAPSAIKRTSVFAQVSESPRFMQHGTCCITCFEVAITQNKKRDWAIVVHGKQTYFVVDKSCAKIAISMAYKSRWLLYRELS